MASVGTRSNDQRAPRARASAAAAAAAAAARSDDGACGAERGNRRDEQRPAELERCAKRGVRQVITPLQRTRPQIARTSALPDPPDGYPNDLGLSRGAPCGAVV